MNTTLPKIYTSNDFFSSEYQHLECISITCVNHFLTQSINNTELKLTQQNLFVIPNGFHVITDTRKIVSENADVLILLTGENADAHDYLSCSLEQQLLTLKKPILIIGHQPLSDIKGIKEIELIKELQNQHVESNIPLIYYLQVSNTLTFLQKWGKVHAQVWRQQFFKEESRIIAVVGSNGKTTTKEMIYSVIEQAVLRQQKEIEHTEDKEKNVINIKALKTEGNYNNHIGVPLTLLRLQPEHQYAVIEVGMNHMGEIAQLGCLVQPDITLLTNTQREHQEFMLNLENVAKENGSMFAFTKKLAVYPHDMLHHDFQELWNDLSAHIRVKTYEVATQINPSNFNNIHNTKELKKELKHIKGVCSSEKMGDYPLVLNIIQGLGKLDTQEFHLHSFGEHTLHNATGVIASTLNLTNVSIEDIQNGLNQFLPPKGRLQPKTLNNRLQTLVIDDTYNANPDSVKAAIDVLSHLPSPKVLVLGDMGEVGEQGLLFHEEVGQYAFEKGIDVFLTIGELAHHAHHAFIEQYHEKELSLLEQIEQGTIKNTPTNPVIADHFSTDEKHIESLKNKVERLTHSSKTILVKGSRFMKMERFLPSE
jgi:UDP-N-acetylmuramoyl-tripeptide--D-alanyl-D-alanine ligase